MMKSVSGRKRAGRKKSRAKKLLALFVLTGALITGSASAGAEANDNTATNDFRSRISDAHLHITEKDKATAKKFEQLAGLMRNQQQAEMSEAAKAELEQQRAEIRAHKNFEDFVEKVNSINPGLLQSLPVGTEIEDLVGILGIDLDRWDDEIADPVATTQAEREELAAKRHMGDGPSKELFKQLFSGEGDKTLFVEMDNYITGVDETLVRMGGPVLMKVDTKAFLRDTFKATEGLYGSLKKRLEAALVMYSATTTFSSISSGYMPLMQGLNGYSVDFHVSFDGGKTMDRYQLVVSTGFKGVHRSQLIAHMASLMDPNQHIERRMNDGELTGSNAVDIYVNFHEIAHADDANVNGHYEPVRNEAGDITHFEDKSGHKLDTASQVRHRHEAYADAYAAQQIIKRYGEVGIRMVELVADMRGSALAAMALGDDVAALDKKDNVSGFVAYYNHEILMEVLAEAKAQLAAGQKPFADMSNAEIGDRALALAKKHTKDMGFYKEALQAFQKIGQKLLAANVDERLAFLDAHIKTLEKGSVGRTALEFYREAVDDLTVQADELPKGVDPRTAALQDWVEGYKEAVKTIGDERVAMEIFRAMINQEYRELINKAVLSALAKGEEPTQDSVQAYLEENVNKIEGKARLALEERMLVIQAAYKLRQQDDNKDPVVQNARKAAFNRAARMDPKLAANENAKQKDRKPQKKIKVPSRRLG